MFLNNLGICGLTFASRVSLERFRTGRPFDLSPTLSTSDLHSQFGDKRLRNWLDPFLPLVHLLSAYLLPVSVRSLGAGGNLSPDCTACLNEKAPGCIYYAMTSFGNAVYLTYPRPSFCRVSLRTFPHPRDVRSPDEQEDLPHR